jgi:hypothetical protein
MFQTETFHVSKVSVFKRLGGRSGEIKNVIYKKTKK